MRDAASQLPHCFQFLGLPEAGLQIATLMAGVTTIQSLGGPEDVDLRDAVARGAEVRDHPFLAGVAHERHALARREPQLRVRSSDVEEAVHVIRGNG